MWFDNYSDSSNYVSRPRLLDKLDSCTKRRLTLVLAPAGWGKTALLREWSVSCTTPVVWIGLKDSDNCETAFERKLISATDVLAARTPDADGAPPIGLSAAIEQLTVLAQQSSSDMVLIFDDYHRITEPCIHEAMEHLLSRLSANLHVCISSRTVPPFSLSLLRSRNQLAELTLDDLSFRTEEILELMPRASESVASFLHNFTDGWIACLQLIQLELNQLPPEDVSAYLRALDSGDAYLWDYLNDVVFTPLPDKLKQFMLLTSILPSFCASLCDSTREASDSAQLIQELQRQNLVFPQDKTGTWFRYPAILLDFLCKKMSDNTTSKQRQAMNLSACRWYEHHGDLVAAANQSCAAGMFDYGYQLLSEYSNRIDARKSKLTLTWQYRVLPFSDDVLLSAPELCFQAALACYLSGDVRNAERPLELAESAYRIDGNQAGLAMVVSTRALIKCAEYNLQDAIVLGQRALEYTGENAQSTHSTGAAALSISTGYYELGRFRDAETWSARAYDAFAAVPNRRLAAVSFLQLAEIRYSMGRLTEAEELLRALIQSGDPFTRAESLGAYCRLGCIYFERNQLDEATDCFTRSLDFSDAPQSETNCSFAHAGLAEILFLTGDQEGSQRQLELALSSTAPEKGYSSFSHVTAIQARIALYQNRLSAAAQILNGIPPVQPDRYQCPHRSEEFFTRMQLLLQRGISSKQSRLFADMQQQLLEQLPVAQKNGAVIMQLRIYLLLALALQGQGKYAKALEMLDNALTLAEPEKFVRTFICQGEPMRQLLTAAQAKKLHPQYTAFLLQQLADAPKPVSEDNLLPADKITERELEILKLVAQGASTASIAQKYVISEATVRTHIRNILSKLSAHSRMQAVEKARSYGLIE